MKGHKNKNPQQKLSLIVFLAFILTGVMFLPLLSETNTSIAERAMEMENKPKDTFSEPWASSFDASSFASAVNNSELTFISGGDAPWGVDSEKSVVGGVSGRSGSITHNQESWVETTVEGSGWISFAWAVSSESSWDKLEFLVGDSVIYSISGEQNWDYIEHELTGSNSYTLRWRYSKDGSVDEGLDCGWIDALTLDGLTPLNPLDIFENNQFSAAVNSSLNFTSSGASTWEIDQGDWFTGGRAARSGSITHNEESWLETIVEGPGCITFAWKVSSENDYDWLEFHVNSTRIERISGEVDWAYFQHTLEENATYILRWLYHKDGSISDGEDCGKIDFIRFAETCLSNPLPSPPRNLIIGEEEGSIRLSWSPPQESRGYSIQNYTIYRAETRNGPFEVIGTTDGTNYTDRLILLGRTYYYQIAAVSEGGEGQPAFASYRITRPTTFPTAIVLGFVGFLVFMCLICVIGNQIGKSKSSKEKSGTSTTTTISQIRGLSQPQSQQSSQHRRPPQRPTTQEKRAASSVRSSAESQREQYYSKQPEDKREHQPTEDEPRFCQFCGSLVKKRAKECGYCGTRF